MNIIARRTAEEVLFTTSIRNPQALPLLVMLIRKTQITRSRAVQLQPYSTTKIKPLVDRSHHLTLG